MKLVIGVLNQPQRKETLTTTQTNPFRNPLFKRTYVKSNEFRGFVIELYKQT